MNMRGMKEKGGETFPKLKKMLDETTHGSVKLTQVTKEGKEEFRSTYDVIKDLSMVWDDLNNMQKSMIAEKFAGKQNANVFFSLMLNAKKDLENIKKTADNSFGSAAQEQEAYMNSLSAKINSLKEDIKGLFLDLSDTDFLKGIISGIDSGVSALRGLIKEFGAIPSVVSLASASMTTLNTQFRKMAIDKNLFGIGKIEELFVSKQYGLNNKIKEQRELIKEIKLTKNAQLGLNKATLSYGVNLGKVKGSIIATKVELGLLRVAATAAQAAISFGVGLVVSFAIEKLVTFIDKLHTTREELKQLNADFFNSSKQANETISKAEEKYSKIKELQNQLANTKNEQEKIELQSELNKLQSEMVTLLPQTKNGLDSQNNAIANNNALIEESIRLKKEEREESAKKIAQENSKHMDVFDKYFENKNNYQKMSSSNSTGLSKFQKLIFTVSGYEGAIKKADTKEVNKELQEQLATITSIKQAVADMKASNMSDIEIKAQFGGVDVFEKIREFDNSLEKTQTTADNTKPSLEGLTNPLDAIKESATSAADELDKLGSKFNKLTGNIGLLQKATEEYKKNGDLSAATVGSMLNSGDTRIISLLADKNKFMENSIALEKTLRTESDATYRQAIQNSQNLLQQGINDLSSKEAIEAQATNHSVGLSNQETQAKMNNYANDTNAHANSENNKSNDSSNGTKDRINSSNNETNQKANNYSTDVKNHGEAEDTKVQNTNNASNTMVTVNGNMITLFGKQYKTDATNFAQLMNDKIDLADACATKLQWTFAQVYKQTGKISEAVRQTMHEKEGLGTDIPIPKKPSILETNPWENLNFNSGHVSANYNPVGVDYSRADNGHGHKGSGSKGNKGSKNGEHVDIKDIEDKIDAYKSLQDVIDDINNELEITKTLEENAQGVNKLQYMNKEINLYKQKKDAINNLIAAKQNEGRYLEGVLKNNGFNVSNGNISNYYDRLKQIEDEVNAMDNSNKAKEQAIKNFKDLKEKADKYFEITSKELPKLNNEWYQLNKTIKEVSERQVKLMGDTEREMTNVVKNQVEERKKALEDETSKIKEELKKQRDEYNKKYDDENFEKNLKEKQDKLNKLNAQIDSVRRDISSEGQSKLKDLLKQKDDLEKELNNFIRDRQKDQGNKAFDEQMDKIDKHKDEKIKEMEKTYTDEKIAELAKGMIQKGFIEIEGHVIKLRDALNDYYKKNGEVFADSSLKMQEFADNIKLVNSLYKDLVAINNNLGVSSSNIRYNSGNNVVQAIPKVASFMAIPQGSKKANININTHLNVGSVNNGTTEDIKSMLDERDRKIINEINEQLNSY
ncbi:hypothetical protein LI014_06235 [Clostridium perfringens]|uniref:hypothetical protein n=1 Tax=Clostridium perfringens TaxID=1502 RepID=UPI002246DBED|nr:hypothetical protein [Clostridium perfringens]MCX0396970.1 hypothetical protein [Clostridium perfringens]